MAKVISIQQKKINGDLQRYAEELETIDRMVNQHLRKQKSLLQRNNRRKNQWLSSWISWRQKWKK